MSKLLVPLLLVSSLIGLACNEGSVVDVPVSLTATPSIPPVTVTPPPCPGGTAVPSAPPNVTITSNIGCGNANKAVLVSDPYDGDGNAYLCVWLCTTEPTNAAPHEVLQEWDMSADDGDGNTLISNNSTLDCCTLQP